MAEPLLRLSGMLRSVLIISALTLINSAGNMDCKWCINVVTNAKQHFGERVSNVTDLQFAEYFVRECRQNRQKSLGLAGICDEMLRNHPLTLFEDLRNHITALQTCVDCNLCMMISSTVAT